MTCYRSGRLSSPLITHAGKCYGLYRSCLKNWCLPHLMWRSCVFSIAFRDCVDTKTSTVWALCSHIPRFPVYHNMCLRHYKKGDAEWYYVRKNNTLTWCPGVCYGGQAILFVSCGFLRPPSRKLRVFHQTRLNFCSSARARARPRLSIQMLLLHLWTKKGWLLAVFVLVAWISLAS